MLALFRGGFAVLRRPALWGYAWKPMAWAALFYLAVFFVGVIYLPWVVGGLVGGPEWLHWLAGLGTGVTFVFLWFFLSGFIYLAVAGLFSSILWDVFSKRLEVELYGDAPSRQPGCLITIYDSLARIVFSLLLFASAFFFGWLGFAIVIAAAGLLSLLDFSSPAYFRRGYAFPSQARRIMKSPGALGFMLSCGLISLVPFLFILLLPAMVAGGTILCRELEGP